MIEVRKPVPIVTIGGFLGAGKTTLVNRLLRQADGERIVVFVNDFGAINIDYDLIEAADTDRISLKNGCVCCTLNDDLIQSIVGFCRNDRPDAFVVEASGVSDPRSLDQSIFTLQSAGHVQLVNRVYVLDADQFGSLDYADTELLIDHAAASDLVLINKSDLVGVGRLQDLEAVLARSTGKTMILKTSHCDVAVGQILQSSSSLDRIWRDAASTSPGPIQHHDEQYRSWSRTFDRPLRREAFHDFLREISGSALRAKGTIVFDDEPGQLSAFDIVGDRLTNRSLGDCPPDKASRLVVIGKAGNLNIDALEEKIETCLARTERDRPIRCTVR